MSSKSSPPISLVIHDGELADVKQMLEEIGTPAVERRNGLSPEDLEVGWALVIATSKRMIELGATGWSGKATLVAILDHDSRTLSNSLGRMGVQLTVRRPVHPAALRALILHSLYRGPEKRASARASIGAPVSLRKGWKEHPAILADLSETGCRLVAKQHFARGASFTLKIPAEVAGGRAFPARARVLDCSLAPEGLRGPLVVTASFPKVGDRLRKKLRAVVQAHATRPAVYTGEAALQPLPASAPEPAVAAPEQALRVRQQPEAADQKTAIEEEASRVLMGRDICANGMRVEAHPMLELGMELELGVHLDSAAGPLALNATVTPDDGSRDDDGFMLRFHPLCEVGRKRFLNLLLDLPSVDSGEVGNLVVAEILGSNRSGSGGADAGRTPDRS